MAQASVGRSMSDHAESSSLAMFPRNADPMSVALRTDGSLNLDDLVHLNQTAPPCQPGPSTIGTRTTTVFTSREQSSGTKPTSAGTGYPINGGNGKGKAIAEYASSLSATHGSGSEAEAEQENNLAGVGSWTGDGPIGTTPLKGAARARKRQRMNRRPKHKKPVVIIHGPGHASSGDDEAPAVKCVSRRNSKDTKYLRQRRNKQECDELDLESGRASHVAERSAPKSLSPTRFYVVLSLALAIALTFALSVFAAHSTGKGRMACTKGIIFSATVIISCFTVLAMVVARRALQEALLAGMLEFLVGFALVTEIHEFMWHAP